MSVHMTKIKMRNYHAQTDEKNSHRELKNFINQMEKLKKCL